ncbi:MAG: HupE/UreJ family protein [Steroidobacteraceae bacterium]
MQNARAITRSFASSRLLLCLVALPGLAFAHPGPHHAVDSWSGFLHPLTGIDHLLAMLAVGLWSVQLGRKAMWVLPAVFPVAMLLGAVLGMANVGLPLIEPMIAASVIVMGAAVACGLRLPVTASAVLISFFAIFHGYAHVAEMPVNSTMASYTAGFVAATVLLNFLGVRAGLWLAHTSQAVTRMSGTFIALTGAVLMVV